MPPAPHSETPPRAALVELFGLLLGLAGVLCVLVGAFQYDTRLGLIALGAVAAVSGYRMTVKEV